ncbi:MAG: hypothetical protein NVS2B4_21810 [Ramlibacter sp.]
MPQQPTVVGNRHATDYQGSPWHQRMHVPAFADAQVHGWRLLSTAAASAKSSGQVTLMFCALPATSIGRRPSAPMAEASSVTSPPAYISARRNSPMRNIYDV